MSECIEHKQGGMSEKSIRKILYLGDPVIKFNQIESSILSIIDKEPYFQEWFYNNFIQLVIGKTAHWGAFLFANSVVDDCPWIKNTKIDRDMIRDNILTFLKDNLNQEKYVWLNIETKNIPIYDSVIVFHDILIYGYDEDKKIVTV